MIKSVYFLIEGGGVSFPSKMKTCQFNIDFFLILFFCLQAIIDSTGNNLTLIFLLAFFKKTTLCYNYFMYIRVS